MRELKFRAWDSRGYMVHNIIPNGNTYLQMIKATGTDTGEYEIYDHNALMQYTGLKDKNDVEIYEGDILNFIKDIAVVEYVHTEFLAISKRNENWCNILSEDSIVIGNIYENKELLK